MKKQMSLRAAMMMGLALPASAAFGQFTGTSHPDEVPVMTTDDSARQPVVYTPAVAPAAVQQTAIVPNRNPPADFKPRRTVDPDSLVVGDPGTMDSVAAPTHEVAFTRAGSPGADDRNGADIDAGVVTRVAGPANGLPVGTLVRTKMLQGFSTRTTEEGSEWRAELMEPLMRDGRVLIPAGAVIRGKVTEVHGGKRISGKAGIHLQPIAVMMPDGTSMGLHAQVIDTNLYGSTVVDNEGTILHRDHKKEEAGVLALTTGSGAAAGAMVGGVPGALIGAGLGAGVSTVLWLKQDRQAEIPRNTQVTFELTRPMVLGQE